jgi:hypothetical protein
LAVRIRNYDQPHRTLGLSTSAWSEMLKLALSNGWQPLGSVSPEAPSMDIVVAGISWQNREGEVSWQEDELIIYQPSAMLFTYLPFWSEDGHPNSEINRLVLLEDALNFADALDRAYQAYEPIRVPTFYFLFEPDDPALGQRPSLGALAAALEVCRQGSFSIEPWRYRA